MELLFGELDLEKAVDVSATTSYAREDISREVGFEDITEFVVDYPLVAISGVAALIGAGALLKRGWQWATRNNPEQSEN